MNGRDHWLSDLIQDFDPAWRHVRAERRKRGGVVLGLDVGSGAETALAGAANDNGPDFRVVVHAHESFGGLATQGWVDRVDLARSIKNDPTNTIEAVDQDGGGEGLVCHGRHTPTKMCGALGRTIMTSPLP
ncbi:hypothetical protein D3C73_1158260 [compost metagenome]